MVLNGFKKSKIHTQQPWTDENWQKMSFASLWRTAIVTNYWVKKHLVTFILKNDVNKFVSLLKVSHIQKYFFVIKLIAICGKVLQTFLMLDCFKNLFRYRVSCVVGCVGGSGRLLSKITFAHHMLKAWGRETRWYLACWKPRLSTSSSSTSLSTISFVHSAWLLVPKSHPSHMMMSAAFFSTGTWIEMGGGGVDIVVINPLLWYVMCNWILNMDYSFQTHSPVYSDCTSAMVHIFVIKDISSLFLYSFLYKFYAADVFFLPLFLAKETY